jgi:hypothetical protein
MIKFVRWEDDDAKSHNRLRMRDGVTAPDAVIKLDYVSSLDDAIPKQHKMCLYQEAYSITNMECRSQTEEDNTSFHISGTPPSF